MGAGAELLSARRRMNRTGKPTGPARSRPAAVPARETSAAPDRNDFTRSPESPIVGSPKGLEPAFEVSPSDQVEHLDAIVRKAKKQSIVGRYPDATDLMADAQSAHPDERGRLPGSQLSDEDDRRPPDVVRKRCERRRETARKDWKPDPLERCLLLAK